MLQQIALVNNRSNRLFILLCMEPNGSKISAKIFFFGMQISPSAM